jgi:hypothetical protein
MKKNAKLFILFSMAALLAFISGCANKSGAEVKGDQLTAATIANGVDADITVETRANGVLYASEVKIGNDELADTDDIECEDGLTPDGQVCDDGPDEDKGDEADKNDENGTDDIECEDGVTPDGQICEDGQNEDEDDGDADEEEDGAGNELVAVVEMIADDLSSFTVLGGLTIVLDDASDEDVEDDTDEETDDDANEDETELDIATLTVGARVEVAGEYSSVDGIFHADELKTPDEEVIELDGTISDLTANSFSMFGLTISYDRNTSVVPEDNDSDESDEDESGEDDENDGIDCEQEGEHEGDNEGC